MVSCFDRQRFTKMHNAETQRGLRCGDDVRAEQVLGAPTFGLSSGTRLGFSAKVHFAKSRMRNVNNFLEEYEVRAEQVLGAPTFGAWER